jgi:hypothetical protein
VQTPTTGPERQVPPPPATTRRQRREEDLIVIPEARQPGRWRLAGALVAAGLAAVLAVGLAVAYSSERRRADDLEAELATALDDQATLTGEAAAARDRLLLLEGRVIDLEERLRLAQQGRSVLAASRREARRELVRSRDALDAERARIRSFMGPAVADGTHVGKLIAVGANQNPARLITDLGRWFTGPAATQAAIADGAIRPGDTVSRYFRNQLPAWRTLPVDPSATVTLRRWNGSGTYTVSLEELQRLSNAESRRAADVFRSPFSMTLAGGQVTSLRELVYP